MEAGKRSGRSPAGGLFVRARFLLGELGSRVPGGLAASRAANRLPPHLTAIIVTALAVAFVAILTWYGAREFSGRAADTRASNEAMSFADHSSRLATGDAFNGYIQILRFAEDAVVNSKASTPDQRLTALQQLLYVNVNKFDSLTMADRSGIILATTDPSISSVRESSVFIETRADLGTANSDIILPQAGQHGYIEYSVGLRDPADGTLWAILIGRADPATIWHETLLASVDGSRNVIINSEGQFAAGVPDELLRLPWHGHPLPNGAVRAEIAGVDSICGLSVASCLPASIIQAEREMATDKQLLVTPAGAVLVVVIAGAVLYVTLRREPPALAAPSSSAVWTSDRSQALEVVARSLADSSSTSASTPPQEAAAVASPEESQPTEDDAGGHESESDAMPGNVLQFEPPTPPPPPDIDALVLIDAFERRSARLAKRLREDVQARLLIATTRADEAYRLATTDRGLAEDLHSQAMEELERLQESEIRSISQELHPGLVRMGLPAALDRKSVV